MPNDTSSTLLEAEHLINGPRRDEYGPVEESFEDVATVWSIILKKKLTSPLTAHEVGVLQAAWKLCRESVKHKRDNIVDLAGYGDLANKCWNHKNPTT